MTTHSLGCALLILGLTSATAATALQIQRAGSDVTITWTGGGTLEVSEAVGGGWTQVPDAKGTYTFLPTAGTAFFRVKEAPDNSYIPLPNGNFEQGPGVSWLHQPSTATVICRAAELGIAAFEGEYVARLGWTKDNDIAVAIGQYVDFPSFTPLYLNQAIWLYSEDLCDVPYYDTFGLYFDGEPIVENTRLCRDNTGGDGWRRVSIDVSAYAAMKHVLLGFEIAGNLQDPLASVAYLDMLFFGNVPWD